VTRQIAVPMPTNSMITNNAMNQPGIPGLDGIAEG